MILRSRRPCIAALAALLFATNAAAQENHGALEQRAACAPKF